MSLTFTEQLRSRAKDCDWLASMFPDSSLETITSNAARELREAADLLDASGQGFGCTPGCSERCSGYPNHKEQTA